MRVIGWLVVGAAACGGGGDRSNGDATMPDRDAVGDTAAPDLGVAGDVTVRFATARFTQYGPAVFCRDASGAIVTTVALPPITGPTTATCFLPAGGSVDVLTGVGDFAELTSFRDLTAGDDITFNPIIGSVQTDDTTTMTIKTATAGYGAASSCGTFPGLGGDLPGPSTPTDTWQLTGATPCATEPIDLLFLDDYAAPTQFAWQAAVPFVPGGTVTLPAWQPLTSATIALANVPAGLEHLMVDVKTRIGPTDATSFAFDRAVSFQAPTAGAHVATVPGVGTAGRGARVRFESGIGIDVVDERVIVTPGALDGVQVDLADQPLPVPRAAQIHGNTVSWTETGSGTGDLRYVATTRGAIVSGGPAIEWRSYSNPADGARAQTIYPLPDAYANLDWTRGTSAFAGATVTYADSDQATGWAEAKANPTRILDIEYGDTTASRGHRTFSY